MFKIVQNCPLFNTHTSAMADSRMRPSPSSSDGGTPRKRLRMSLKRLGIVKVHGGGVRVLLSWNDSESPFSVVKGILTCKSEDSEFCRKFRGFKHDSALTVNGQSYGRYSYRWLLADSNPAATPQQLAALFRATKHVRLNPRHPYGEGNMKFIVEVQGSDELPMGDVYSDNDIVTHCTSEEQKYALWRSHTNPFDQTQSFFWADSSHSSLADTITEHQNAQNAAPSVNGITF